MSKTLVSTLDWGDFRGSLLTAAFDGEAFGEAVGDLIWDSFGIDGVSGDSCTIRSVHCIGVSVGAFAANACARLFYNKRKESREGTNTPYVRSTLLDPFTSRGV